jgi:hypothetical protein
MRFRWHPNVQKKETPVLLLTYDSEGEPNTGQGQNSRPHFYCQEAQIRLAFLLSETYFLKRISLKLIIVFSDKTRGLILPKEIKADRSTEEKLAVNGCSFKQLNYVTKLFPHCWNAEDQNIFYVPETHIMCLTRCC